MSYLIAVTGKGGTGKSTVSASLIRLLLDSGVQFNQRAADGTTALGRALAKGHRQLGQLLQAKGGVK